MMCPEREVKGKRLKVKGEKLLVVSRQSLAFKKEKNLTQRIRGKEEKRSEPSKCRDSKGCGV